jgi:hypothetical protein
MDIAFGNCLSVGGFCYSLILVDCATQYNWVLGLMSLTFDDILSALRFFWALAGSLKHCFYCDCNAKLFGMAILENLINNNSKVGQSSYGLVELHWNTMVHLARA